MKSGAVVTLAAITGFGLSACSPSQTVKQAGNSSIPEAGPAYASMPQHTFNMPNPAAQNASHFASQTVNRPSGPARNGAPELSVAELRVLGDQIFKNEGGGNVTNLVHWNDGEDFASMGIGHFTWYPAGRKARFGNTFPELLSYMQAKGVPVPAWLPHDAPWRTRSELMQAKNTRQVQELQNFLYQTRLLQAQFIVERAQRAMPKLVNTTAPQLRRVVASNLNAVANTPGGWYALVDYTNFKGEGLNRAGGYNGQNWGLLQVLEEMRPARPGQEALHEFANAAMRVLERRVRNSPPARNERRWMPGWSNRVNTYRRLVV